MGDVGADVAGAGLDQGFGGVHERAARIDDVVDEDAVVAGNVADDVHDFRHARLGAALVDDGEVDAKALGNVAGADHAADVGRDHHGVGDVVFLADVASDDWGRAQIVGRDIEEALDLRGVEIEGEDAVGPGDGDEVGDELGRDGGARCGFAVLTGIAEIGQHRGDAAGRGAAERVDQDQQLHQIVVGGEARRLQDEDVLTADVLVHLDEYFLVGEALDGAVGEGELKVVGDSQRQGPVRVAGDQFHGARPVA